MKTRKILALVLSIVMVFSLCSTAMAAHLTDEITDLEIKNSDISKYVATESYVLLANNGVLPFEAKGSIALFGNGAVATIKGGTGSGAVNNRANDNVYAAFVAAGWEIANPTFIGTQSTSLRAERAITDAELAEAVANTDLALYVISRQAGEGSDRQETSGTGSFTLTAAEQANIALLADNFDRFIVVYNTCMMDTDAVRDNEGVDAVFFMSNGGQRGSEALVDVLTGVVTPSGKLADTWALDLNGELGYPSTDMGFSWVDGNTATEYYNDGIYVGYRYFDTWGLPVAYEFGFGLSYTEFDIDVINVAVDADEVEVVVDVTNVGDTYSGKEVVQVYFSAPDGELEKPYQELAAFGKTDTLAPGEKQTLTLTYATADMGSYSEDRAAYIMDAGDYIIRVGNSSRNTKVAAVATLDELVITEQLSNQVVPEEDADLEEITKAGKTPISYEGEAAEIAAAPKFALEGIETVNNASPYDDETVTTYLFAEDAANYKAREGILLRTKNVAGIVNNNPALNNGGRGYSETVYNEVVEVLEALPAGYTKENVKLTDVYDGKITLEQFVASMTVEELANLCVGLGWGGGGAITAPDGNPIGSSSSSVNGGAGQTTNKLFYSRYIPSMPNADGPAGIRITRQYNSGGVTYYQYCTAFPAGSCYTMSWDPAIYALEGEAIGSEMFEYGVTTWLAPGMNIHRNPLCGRNFEYYSEDPFLTGITAAYVTASLQSFPGIGLTLKHYWGNSQENNRNAVNNVISERASREIYLKGFEIAVKYGRPQCIMTCYNCNNGWPGADDYDVCTDLARGEWGFTGYIMTDWGGGQSSQYISMHAGNDMIMPGGSPQTIYNNVGITEPVINPVDGTISNAGTFTAAKGGVALDPVTITGEVADSVIAAAQAGQASVTIAGGNTTVTWYGNHVNRIALGDLQKSAIAVLKVAMLSQDMAKLYAGAPFNKEIDLVPYSEANGALITEGWTMVTKGDVVNASLVVGSATLDLSVDNAAAIDVTYAGDEALTAVTLKIDSALPIASIDSKYEVEYNEADGSVLVWDVNGIEGVLCTINYEVEWTADGEYAIDVDVIDAANGDAETTSVVAIDGAIIIDNTYSVGDIDFSGSATVADVVTLARYLVNKEELSADALDLADLDANGKVNNADLIKLARAVLNGGIIGEAYGTYTLVVEGYDWGAAATKVIVDLSKKIDADSVDASDFVVINTTQGCGGTSKSTRQVTDAFTSDAEGNEVSESSNYVTIEMYVSPDVGGAFYYDFIGSGLNDWPNPYTNEITLAANGKITYDGIAIRNMVIDVEAADRVSPLADQFEKKEFTAKDGIKLNYGVWAPAEDEAKNPMIIWLHGAGEGGTDNHVVTLGNKVANLITDDIQKYFRDEDISGAYVLTPQSPTMWMNDGTGEYTTTGKSMYTAALYELITSYVASNPDIDVDRIYIGGCSNGGYMTMNMIMTYPDYFAAAYPICEAYTDAWITDAQIEAIKDIPIWFTHAANDTTVNPTSHTVATYNRLVAAGAENVHFSFFDDVHDTTGTYTQANGTPYQYMGHWSWIYTLNNECVEEDGTTIMEWLAAQTNA